MQSKKAQRKRQKQPIRVESQFVVRNDRGLHTRPSTELVKLMARFEATVFLHYGGFMANAKSLLGVLTLAAAKGARVRIEASGEDAEQAVEALLELAELQFNMDY
jgi:phosphocarrier protein